MTINTSYIDKVVALMCKAYDESISIEKALIKHNDIIKDFEMSYNESNKQLNVLITHTDDGKERDFYVLLNNVVTYRKYWVRGLDGINE